MELIVLGSSSAGNCYILRGKNECLLVELGLNFKVVFEALNFDISHVVGAIVSHEHGDHAKYVAQCLEAQIPVYSSLGTIDALKMTENYLLHAVEELKPFKIGEFTIMPFAVQHDAAQPFGYLIQHPECGTILFATDTYYLQYRFNGLNQIMLECNYRKDILEENVASGRLHEAVRLRTIKSHCSFDTCREILQANDLTKVNNIVLIHLSPGNADPEEFQKGIEQATGKRVHVASKGKIINFNKLPF